MEKDFGKIFVKKVDFREKIPISQTFEYREKIVHTADPTFWALHEEVLLHIWLSNTSYNLKVAKVLWLWFVNFAFGLKNIIGTFFCGKNETNYLGANRLYPAGISQYLTLWRYCGYSQTSWQYLRSSMSSSGLHLAEWLFRRTAFACPRWNTEQTR